MAKSITRNSSVIKIITTALVKTADDYFAAESEWGNGSRSDLVLSPRSSSSQLAPIVIEFQRRVDKKFMKRVIMYALQAYRRYKKDPVMLIICSGTLSDDVANLLKSSDVLGCRRYPCEGWGAKCLIMTKESLSTLTASEKRQPFASFGLFLTQSVPFSELSSDDETTKMLQSLAVDHYMSLIGNEAHLIDFFKAVLDKQEIFYNKILALADDDDKPRLREAINDAQVEQRELKRKLDQLEDDGDDGDDDYNNAVDDSNGNAADDNTDDTVDDNNDVDDDRVADKKTLYKKGMEFVAKYKKARMDKGKKRMDWQACMAAGRKEGLLLNYKNTNTLKNQFAKFEGNGDE